MPNGLYFTPVVLTIFLLPALPDGRYITDIRLTLARVMYMARAYSLEQQNAGRAHAGLCRVSSCK